MKTKSFRYEFQGSASHHLIGGDVMWDDDKKQWKATIITQSEPEVKFEAWDKDSSVAGLICCAKWMGRDLLIPQPAETTPQSIPTHLSSAKNRALSYLGNMIQVLIEWRAKGATQDELRTLALPYQDTIEEIVWEEIPAIQKRES